MIDEETWSQLAVEAPGPHGIIRRRMVPDSERDLFIGVRQPSAERIFILRVPTDFVGESVVSKLPRSGALASQVVAISDEDAEIRILLVDTMMASVFSPFVSNVIDETSNAASDDDAVARLVAQVERWQQLFSGGSRGLGPEHQRGLFGELWTMRHVLTGVVGVEHAVASWDGPDHDLRDFNFGGVAVEVKTTVSAPPAEVTISSERQLDDAPVDRLLLVVFELDRATGASGDSLNAQVDSTLAAAGNARSALETKLLQYGYHDLHRDSYDSPRYVLRKLNFFEVEGDFPRITPSGLPAGVGGTKYRLSVGACEPWRITVDQLRDIVSTSS